MPWQSTEATNWTTLRARLTVWNTAVVLLMTAATLATVWLGGRTAMYREVDATLRGNVREVAIAVADLYPDIDAVIEELRRKQEAHAERGWFTHLLFADGTTLWQSDRCPPMIAAYPPQAIDQLENIVQLGPYRYVRQAIDLPNRRVLHVRLGKSTEMLESHVTGMLRLLALVAVAALLLTPLAGYWLAVRATRPVAEILETADRLEPTRLGDRLRVSGAGDELDRLALTINRLLDRVAAHVERQERFVADAAHELRGPLTAMQSVLEVAMAHDRAAPEYRETLVEVLEAARHLAKLANDLLLLAESADTSAPRIRDSVDVARVAGQACEMFAGVAEERGISLVLETPARPIVEGDAGRLRQVVGNLLDNALRFTPRDGRVTVRIADVGGECLLTIQDTGTGISAGDLERIFDRFAMVDRARSRAGGDRCGGLGLAICKSIVEVCGGSIAIASPPGAGTTVTVRLPAIAGSTRDTARGGVQPQPLVTPRSVARPT